MENKLIKAGIRNLKGFGYPSVNADNILTDMVYSQFFRQMLEETKKQSNPCFAEGAMVIRACDSLIARLG